MLEKLFGSKLRARILAWLYLHPDERCFGRQLAELLDEDPANTSRELARLARMGILTCVAEGIHKYYQANRRSPFFAELQGLVVKTGGLVDVLSDALKPLAGSITSAFVYGSFARGAIGPDSDVDVMVIGSCTFGDVVEATSRAQERLGREINPSVYPVGEFRSKVASGHHFLLSVLKEPKIFLIGNDDELGRLAQ